VIRGALLLCPKGVARRANLNREERTPALADGAREAR